MVNAKSGVVILNYNSHDLTKCLAEKVADMPSVDAVCVVDNNSNDDFEGEFSHPKIHYIKNTCNAGYSAGNNVGLRYLVEKCKCDYVFIANPDVVFENEVIQQMCKILDSTPQLALISTRHVGYNGAQCCQYYEFHHYWRTIMNCFFVFRLKYERERRQLQNKKINESNTLVYVDAVPGCFFGIRSKFLKQNQYLYEGIFMYGEEYTLGRQAKLLGYKAAIIPTITFIHNHEHKPLHNARMFRNDRESIKRYFKMFDNISPLKYLLLSWAICIGTMEYSIACFLKKTFDKF